MTSPSQFVIRPATIADIPAIRTLVDLSVRGLQQSDYSPTQIDASIGSVFGTDRQLLEDKTYFVATPLNDPSQLVACGGWSYRRTQLNPATDFAKIRAIFVHPAWSRRGLGTMILAHCEEAAHAAGFNRFEMGSTLTGVPLYSLKGYTERERTEVLLPNGETLEVVVMDKTLA